MSRSIKLVPTEEEPLAEVTATRSNNLSPESRKRAAENEQENEEQELENEEHEATQPIHASGNDNDIY